MHREVQRSWPSLRRRYRENMGELVSREAWEAQVFSRFR
jgi:galactofuranosylgalactofuranosylrhamnosyl-N-acetylglucosaminyl-diphospho-decaprenol beta-1,5/1,6-galactofuranosyltransferase